MTGPGEVVPPLVVTLAVAIAVGGWCGWRGRPVRRLAGQEAGRGGWSLPRVPGRRRSREPPERRLSALVTDVTGLLRTGVDPATAWRRVGVAVDRTGVPAPAAIRAVLGDGRAGADVDRHVAAVVAAARVAASAGTPLVRVLEQVGAGLEVDQEVEAERRVALAGPRATARLLAWLPVVGLLLGALVGADPVGVALGGGVGTAAVVAGGVLLGLGRAWVAREVRAARRAAERR